MVSVIMVRVMNGKVLATSKRARCTSNLIQSLRWRAAKLLGGPIGWCQNCHSSKMGTTPKQGQKNHFQKL